MYDQPPTSNLLITDGRFVFVTTNRGSIPVDLIALLRDEISKTRETIQDAETTLDLLDSEYGKLLTITCKLADRLRELSPGDGVIRELDSFLNGEI